jgi:phenylalanyl-tRNA synthetase beta chain
MKVSLNWLKRYVDITVSPEELCNRMTMAGFEVDGVEDLSKTMDNVVAARILKLEKHPDADKLQICTMDVGADEPVQIVTGAQNVFEGALVPAALHDSHLPNGMHIKKGKLRGVASNGMLCSGEELCLKESDYPGAEVYGILILHEDCPAGTDMREVLHLNDMIIDFSVLANRPDCQSVLGLAREVAVVLGTECRLPVPAYHTAGGDIHDNIQVEVISARGTTVAWSRICASHRLPTGCSNACAARACARSTTSWTSPTLSCWKPVSRCTPLT